ncbi:hypothetical protein N665_0283s0025 [Sinapis alba]|nr:hypothetical protein N665_0283s0025 [Sinapis alba]
MDKDKSIMSLNNDDDYLSENDNSEHVIDENNHVAVDESLMSTSKMVKGKHKQRNSRCWKNFTIIGDKMFNGKHKIDCNHCRQHYFIDFHNSGTSTLLLYSKHCFKTLGSTPGNSSRTIDQLIFREMIDVAIVEHDLPYSSVEYRRIREAYQHEP